MKEIWTADEAEYHGRYVDFDKMWAYPKPAQRPHPPIIMGGDGPTTFDRVVEYCDGWMPIGGRPAQGPSLSEKIAMLRRQAKEAGRDPESISVSIFGAQPDADLIGRMEAGGRRQDRLHAALGREIRGPASNRPVRQIYLTRGNTFRPVSGRSYAGVGPTTMVRHAHHERGICAFCHHVRET